MLTLGCCYGLLAVVHVSGENVIHINSEANHLLNRVKRQGGGGFIPFRPLFVYRQQQRERQERWKEIEAKKKLREQYEQYEAAIKENQLYSSHRPAAPVIPYKRPAIPQYSSYSNYYYPYNRYTSYSPTYYSQYEQDPYSNYYQNYYQNYYDGYDYS